MQLQLTPKSETSIQAGYVCTCGCKPRVVYEQESTIVDDTCCCGTHFVVGRDAETHLRVEDGSRVEVQEFDSPWGEPLEAAWAVGAGEHPH